MREINTNAGRTVLTEPIWMREGAAGMRERAELTARPEVLVAGAGIAGLTTAYLLAKEGKRVAVVDARGVAAGETGRTSAHLASAIDDRFTNIVKMHGEDAGRLHHESHASAIDMIERICETEGIDCDFARVDGFLFLSNGESVDVLLEEQEAATRCGADCELYEHGMPGGVGAACLRFSGQGRFHPIKYVNGLARRLGEMGAEFLSRRRVVNMQGNGPVEVTLEGGQKLEAAAGVAATNVPSPINDWLGAYVKQAAYRTYIVVMDYAEGEVRDALYWDYVDPYHYVRLHWSGGKTYLIVGGEDHKTGHMAADRDPFGALEQWARRWFRSAGRVVSTWSGQVNEPDDGVAMIGRAPTRGHEACYVITGDSGMGLTHGTIGGMLVSDLILGRANPWTDIYSPKRRPLRSARALATAVKENLTAGVTFGNYLTAGEVDSVEKIGNGQGAVVRRGLKKLAAYRDEGGTLHECSAVCPHLKCLVQWNRIEKSWDCPCHGSRFDTEGRMIVGPAVSDLARGEDDQLMPERATEGARAEGLDQGLL